MSFDSSNRAERTTVALESIAASLRQAVELTAWTRPAPRPDAPRGAPLIDGNCNEPVEYLGRVLRCEHPAEHMGNHLTRVPGGEMRWTLVAK